MKKVANNSFLLHSLRWNSLPRFDLAWHVRRLYLPALINSAVRHMVGYGESCGQRAQRHSDDAFVDGGRDRGGRDSVVERRTAGADIFAQERVANCSTYGPGIDTRSPARSANSATCRADCPTTADSARCPGIPRSSGIGNSFHENGHGNCAAAATAGAARGIVMEGKHAR